MDPSQKVNVGDNERQLPTYTFWEFGGVIDTVSARHSEPQARAIDMSPLRAKIKTDAKQLLAHICSGLVTLCS
jgi:hypothetical protein